MDASQIANAYASNDRLSYDKPPHLAQATSADSPKNPPARNRANNKRPFQNKTYRQSAPSFSSAPVFAPAPGNEIIAHSLDANRTAAAEFKAMLTTDEPAMLIIDEPVVPAEEETAPEVPPSSIPLHPYLAYQSPPGSSHLELEVAPHRASHSPGGASVILAKAYQREYQPRDRGDRLPRPASGSPCTKVDATPGQVSHRESSVVSTGTTGYKRARSPAAPAERLLLHGLDAKRARNEYGKSFGGGQELGVGVIGGQSAGAGGTTVVVSESGCDIPMFREASAGHGEDARQYQISLDPDLPPLAVEHPARVWNMMLHSLDADLQPVVKWDYEKMEAPEGEDGDYWVAHLTLILPPTHPTIAEHPLFRTLPKNRYKREYVAAVEALGGIKQWTGEPKKLKADAQNNTLVKCISEDAMAWVHAPNGLSVVPDEEDEEEPSYRLIGAPPSQPNGTHPHPELHHPQPMLATPESDPVPAVAQLHQAVNDDEIIMDDFDVDGPAELTNSADPTTPQSVELSAPSARTEGHGLPAPERETGHPEPSHFVQFMDIIHRALGPGGLDVLVPAYIETTVDPVTHLYGCHISVGLPSVKMMEYDVDKVYDAAVDARDAVCGRALQLGVEEFLVRITEIETKRSELEKGREPLNRGESSQGTEAKTRNDVGVQVGDIKPDGEMANKVEPTAGSTAMAAMSTKLPEDNERPKPGLRDDAIDWQKRLAAFCSDLGIPPPVYRPTSQVIADNRRQYTCAVIVADERFDVQDSRPSLTQAIRAAAKQVLVEHFGQPAI
ncbi:hypothetical protein IAT38_000403 [Cryptococcus sp. DSM 104549]